MIPDLCISESEQYGDGTSKMFPTVLFKLFCIVLPKLDNKKST